MILGASGFLGGALYKELYRYYDTFGTYHTGKIYSDNKHYLHFDVVQDDIYSVLNEIRPDIVISTLRGDFDAQEETHENLMLYAARTGNMTMRIGEPVGGASSPSVDWTSAVGIGGASTPAGYHRLNPKP